MLLSCIGQRSLSNSGVLEGLLNLLDSLLSPLQQPQAAAAQRRTEGQGTITVAGLQRHSKCLKCWTSFFYDIFWSRNYKLSYMF